MKELTIDSVSTFTDFATLSVIDNSANNKTDCLDSLNVYFSVTIDDPDDLDFESRSFEITTETQERYDGMCAYNGYEMMISSSCGSDESTELIEFMDGDETFIDELINEAEQHAKSYLESLLQDRNDDEL